MSIDQNTERKAGFNLDVILNSDPPTFDRLCVEATDRDRISHWMRLKRKYGHSGHYIVTKTEADKILGITEIDQSKS